MSTASPHPEELMALRLRNQQISVSRPRFKTPAQLLSWMGGIQGQDYGGAKWSIGLRLAGCSAAVVDKAIATGSIVRTWPMRGTLHFVAAADAHWLLALTSPGNLAAMTRRHRELNLDADTFAASASLFQNVLQGGEQLTRDELYALLLAAGIDAAGQRGYHLLWHAASSGLICGGTPQGKQQTFALLDDVTGKTPRFTPADRPHACAELAQRYFQSHGPATWKDFLWWSGLPAADARAGLEAITPRMVSAEWDKKVYWMMAAADSATEPGTEPKLEPDIAHALPGFDEYLLGYQDRSLVLDARHAAQVCPGNNGMFMPTMVIGQRVAGTWRRSETGRGVTVSTAPFTPLPAAKRKLFGAAASRYAAFLGLPLRHPS
ncbi:MAG: winged helix DNA-binding domain-containing protein [Pseudomonadota bacterium]